LCINFYKYAQNICSKRKEGALACQKKIKIAKIIRAKKAVKITKAKTLIMKTATTTVDKWKKTTNVVFNFALL
jgi:hypothetical protein